MDKTYERGLVDFLLSGVVWKVVPAYFLCIRA